VTTFRYLIIGGGMTADAAARAVANPTRTAASASFPPIPIRLITVRPCRKDSGRATIRKRLSGAAPRRSVPSCASVGARPPSTRSRKTVTDDRGNVLSYDKLLLATGGTPRRLPLQRDRSSITAPSTITGGCVRSPTKSCASRCSAADSSDPRSRRRCESWAAMSR